MTPRRLASLFVLALLGLAPASRIEDIDDLVRGSNVAFHRGDLGEASALLERAQRLAPDPRLVAFNLATIRYHQARAGQMSALAEAEVLYRCCIEPGDIHRAEALLGLGSCLLARGSSGFSGSRPSTGSSGSSMGRSSGGGSSFGRSSGGSFGGGGRRR